MKFTEEEMELLDRHYTKIRIFGKVFLWWDTSPRAVLKHLQELKVKNFIAHNVQGFAFVWEFENISFTI